MPTSLLRGADMRGESLWVKRRRRRDDDEKKLAIVSACGATLAFVRTSLPWRSSRTSRSGSLLRSFCAVVSPLPRPASRSAC